MENTFKKNLNQAIKDKKMKQEQIAKLINTTQQNISLYIRGKTDPSIETIYKLCEILEVTPNELFGIYEWQFTEKREVKKEGDTFHINKMRDINIKK